MGWKRANIANIRADISRFRIILTGTFPSALFLDKIGAQKNREL